MALRTVRIGSQEDMHEYDDADYATALETSAPISVGGIGTSDLDASEKVAFSNDISPAQITSNQNNYNPTGLGDASVLRIYSDASRDITGLAGGEDGRFIILHNIGSYFIVLKSEDVSSIAGNRFKFVKDFWLNPFTSCWLQYDITTARWRLVGDQTGRIPATFSLVNVITPAQITADQDNYYPSGWYDATVMRLSSDASRNITGVAGIWEGRILIIHNVGSFNIVIINDATSTAAYRFKMTGDKTLAPNETMMFRYDATTYRWRILSHV